MGIVSCLRKVKSAFPFFGKQKFECPVCGFIGAFQGISLPTGFRKHAKCPECGAMERHRIQYLVVNDLLKNKDTSRMKMLHVAPEIFFKEFFADRFGQYETADLNMEGVDYQVDLQSLPFPDCSYDFIFASHVLEHIPDDNKALMEIGRVLRVNGIAVLPVPLVAERTIEYQVAIPSEEFHVRAPGLDYFDRFRSIFHKVELLSSEDYDHKHQTYLYEDRTGWPNEGCPLRVAMPGKKHLDIVPVCFK